jgi:hypothetical protein
MRLPSPRAVLLGAALITTATPAAAQTYLGAGGVSCDEYVEMRRTGDAIGRSVDQWLLGYVSGLNFAMKAVRQVDPLIATEGSQVVSYVTRYCAANRGAQVVKAANDFYFALPK